MKKGNKINQIVRLKHVMRLHHHRFLHLRLRTNFLSSLSNKLSMESPNRCSVIIVGVGISGISATKVSVERNLIQFGSSLFNLGFVID